jgi:hypothetical protein
MSSSLANFRTPSLGFWDDISCRNNAYTNRSWYFTWQKKVIRPDPRTRSVRDDNGWPRQPMIIIPTHQRLSTWSARRSQKCTMISQEWSGRPVVALEKHRSDCEIWGIAPRDCRKLTLFCCALFLVHVPRRIPAISFIFPLLPLFFSISLTVRPISLSIACAALIAVHDPQSTSNPPWINPRPSNPPCTDQRLTAQIIHQKRHQTHSRPVLSRLPLV